MTRLNTETMQTEKKIQPETDIQIETRASKTLLHEPIAIHPLKTGIFLSLFFIRFIHLRIYPLYYTTLVKMSQYIIAIKKLDSGEVNEDPIASVFTGIQNNAEIFSKILACAILNNWLLIKLFHRPLARYFSTRIKPKEFKEILDTILLSSDTISFLSTIVCVGGLNIINPKT